MKITLHLVLETPGTRALEFLQSATENDSPPPHFLLSSSQDTEVSANSVRSWKIENGRFDFEILNQQEISANEVFLFMDHESDLADQIEATLLTLNTNDQLMMGRLLLFVDANILINPSDQFQEWLDGASHFADVMLFVNRSNENASAIQSCQDRYASMRYPMETFILNRKNAPWARILDPSPRRLSHVFDDPELLEPEDLPENDRFLRRLPIGDRERTIPIPFD